MSELKVGDYVRVKKFNKRPIAWNSKGKMDHLMGKICKVTGISVLGDIIKIYDKKYDYSWRFNKEVVEKVSNTIVIYTKGNQVIALDKATGEKAVAKCHPDDEFDFNIGAKLAFERLMGCEEKPENKIQDFAKAMYEIRSNLEKAGFTKQESMDFVIKLSLKGLYPN